MAVFVWVLINKLRCKKKTHRNDCHGRYFRILAAFRIACARHGTNGIGLHQQRLL